MPSIDQMKLSELQLDGGGTYDPSTLMGLYTDQFLRTWMPPPGEAGANGDHSQQLLDMWWSLMQIVGNACQLQVCKEATDSDVQYSVTAGKVTIGGVLVTFAGSVNYGPLTAGSLNYIYALFTDPTTVTIGNATTGWPTTKPHLKLATIDQPASGPWRAENLTRFIGAQAAVMAGVGVVQSTREVAFAYNTSSPISLGFVPAGARIDEAFVDVTTTFDGGFAGSIGDSGSNSRHMATGDVAWGSTGGNTKRNHYRYAASTEINLYLTPGAATQGAGYASIKWRL